MNSLSQNLYITYSNQKARDLKRQSTLKPLDKVITLDNLILELFESRNFEIIIDETITSSIIYKIIRANKIEYFIYLSEDAVSLKTDVEDKLVAYIEAFGEFLKERSCLAALLTHEFADSGGNLPKSATVQLAKMLGILTSIINEGVENGVFKTENPMIVQMMIVSPLILHQTTWQMRQKVAKHVTGDFKVLPEPDIKDMAKILSKKIIFALRGTTYE